MYCPATASGLPESRIGPVSAGAAVAAWCGAAVAVGAAEAEAEAEAGLTVPTASPRTSAAKKEARRGLTRDTFAPVALAR
jgi:hypothetical protein